MKSSCNSDSCKSTPTDICIADSNQIDSKTKMAVQETVHLTSGSKQNHVNEQNILPPDISIVCGKHHSTSDLVPNKTKLSTSNKNFVQTKENLECCKDKSLVSLEKNTYFSKSL